MRGRLRHGQVAGRAFGRAVELGVSQEVMYEGLVDQIACWWFFCRYCGAVCQTSITTSIFSTFSLLSPCASAFELQLPLALGVAVFVVFSLFLTAAAVPFAPSSSLLSLCSCTPINLLQL